MTKWSGFGGKNRAELGRSMIEMLGVLAIVGVLSIGGISAFQKAMTKHKINKTTEEFSQFINELLMYSKDLKHMHTNNETVTHIPIAPSIEFLLPSKWKRDSQYLYDSMNNRIRPFLRNDWNVKDKYLSIDYTMQLGKDNFQLCLTLYDMVKSNPERLRSIWIHTQDQENTSGSQAVWGTDYCNNNRKCITDISLADIKRNCDVCDSTKIICSFAIVFRLY